jgi:hypothetical protein
MQGGLIVKRSNSSNEEMSMRVLAFVPILIAGCASTPGAKPHDMSAARHEAVAAAHETQAGEGSLAQRARDCPDVGSPTPCWTLSTRAAEAEKHAKMAADHRAASQALRDTEARACAGVPEADRDMSPFAHAADITSITPLNETFISGRYAQQQPVGVIVTFRAVPGLSAEWLQRVIECHMARNAVLGHEAAAMDYCPLVPDDITARVSSTGNGFAVILRGTTPKAISALAERAELLRARSATVGK